MPELRHSDPVEVTWNGRAYRVFHPGTFNRRKRREVQAQFDILRATTDSMERDEAAYGVLEQVTDIPIDVLEDMQSDTIEHILELFAGSAKKKELETQ